MGVKYYVELIIRKYCFYETMWTLKHIRYNLNSVLNVIIEIARDDNTVSAEEYREVISTYISYLERYWKLVNSNKIEY